MINTFDQEVKKIADEVAILVEKKQRDYGSKNILNNVVDPKIAIAVRLNDKIQRLVNLSSSTEEPQNETLKDTANDIIGYGIVLRMVIDGTFQTPLRRKNEN